MDNGGAAGELLSSHFGGITMPFTITGGRVVTEAADEVKVTLGCTFANNDGSWDDCIAIQFAGIECHVIQVFTRSKNVGGGFSGQQLGTDVGGRTTFGHSDWEATQWYVDTTSNLVPYYDAGYLA